MGVVIVVIAPFLLSFFNLLALWREMRKERGARCVVARPHVCACV